MGSKKNLKNFYKNINRNMKTFNDIKIAKMDAIIDDGGTAIV